MSLPILPSHRGVSTEDLIRFYHQTAVEWTRQIAEETLLDCGLAFANAHLNRVRGANQMLEASLADGQSPADAIAEADAHYRCAGTRCYKWVLNPAVPLQRTAPLAEHLVGLGYTRQELDIMYLAGQPASPIREVSGLQIIPARASYRHARALWEEWAAVYHEPQLADAGMLNLEDPQTDGLVAIKDGVAAAFVAVLTMGEIGVIEDLFVSEKFRGQGIGRTMLSRALEICARSLFKHVFLEADCQNERAVGLYTKLGFRRIGPDVSYHARP
jgi:ribosomal protein S18 acetylase RimI-like enzyme